jgi:hypothetical protein
MIAITYSQAQQNQIATLAEEQPRPQRTDEEWDAEVLAWKRQLWQIRDLPEGVLGLAPPNALPRRSVHRPHCRAVMTALLRAELLKLRTTRTFAAVLASRTRWPASPSRSS